MRFFLLLALAVSAQASIVIIRPGDFPGTPSRQPVTITNLSNPLHISNMVYTVSSKPYQPTNNYGGVSNLVSAPLHAGSYRALVGQYSIAFYVPDDTNTYWLSELATNGATVGSINSIFAVKSNSLFYGSEPKLNGTNFSTLYGGTGGSGSTETVSAGTGILVTNTGNDYAVSVDTDTIATLTSASNIVNSAIQNNTLSATDTGTNYTVNTDKPVDFGTNLMFRARQLLEADDWATTAYLTNSATTAPRSVFFLGGADTAFAWNTVLPITRSTNDPTIDYYLGKNINVTGSVIITWAYSVPTNGGGMLFTALGSIITTNPITTTTGTKGNYHSVTLTGLGAKLANSEVNMTMRVTATRFGTLDGYTNVMVWQPALSWNQTLP